MKSKITIIIIAATALIMLSVAWLARPGGQNKNGQLQEVSNGGTLAAQEDNFDFGSISMAAGPVSRSFKLKNTGPGPLTIEKIYTSCMCTTASLTIKDRTVGQYGMPGHSFIPKINQTIEPNEEATVEVVFDPAAHGPAGVGKIERGVIIENDAGQDLQLNISALVTP